jgi:hypothetical protein
VINNIISEYLPYFFLGIGLIAIAVSILYTSKNVNQKTKGILVEGIVYEQDYENNVFFSTSGVDSYNIKDKITVRFLTRKDEWITGAIKQDFALFYNQYKDGQTVKVYYEENNPNNFYVDTGQSEFLGRLFIAFVGLVFTTCGLYKILF